MLQCPDCNTKHPLDVASSAPSFRCDGCGRVLKVPSAFIKPAPDGVDGAHHGDDGDDGDDGDGAASNAAPSTSAAAVRVPVATRSVAAAAPVAPVASAPAILSPTGPPGATPSPRLTRAAAGAVPFGVRIVLWMIAVPAGFIVVFGTARFLGLFTSTQLENVFLENGWNRFWPVARLLPVVALVTAGLVQGGVEGVSRWRHRRAVARMTAPPRMSASDSARKRARTS